MILLPSNDLFPLSTKYTTYVYFSLDILTAFLFTITVTFNVIIHYRDFA